MTGAKPHLRLDCRGNLGNNLHRDTRSLLNQRAPEKTRTEKVCSLACRTIMYSLYYSKWHFILHEEKEQMKQEAFRSYRTSLFSNK